MKKRIIWISLILVVFISICAYASVAMARNDKVVKEIPQPQLQIDPQEIAEVQELFIIINDLMMAVDMRNAFIEGNKNKINFSDGTEIIISVPPEVIIELDKKIADLKELVIIRADEKRDRWIKELVEGE